VTRGCPSRDHRRAPGPQQRSAERARMGSTAAGARPDPLDRARLPRPARRPPCDGLLSRRHR
jgi:hypothetical protein